MEGVNACGVMWDCARAEGPEDDLGVGQRQQPSELTLLCFGVFISSERCVSRMSRPRTRSEYAPLMPVAV